MRMIKLVLLMGMLFIWTANLSAQQNDYVQADTTCLLRGEEMFMYGLVEEKPLFNGEEDLNVFLQWFHTNIRIPEEYKDASFQGMFAVEFIINRNGYLCNARVIRPVDRLLDAEVLRVVNESPKWQPAVNRSKNVSVKVVIPVRIKF